MKTTQKLITVLALVLGLGSVHAAPVFVQLATGNGDFNFASTAWRTGIYGNISYKINNRYTITPEISVRLRYNAKNRSFFSPEHRFVRVLLNDKNLSKFSNWVLAMAYRYSLPTDLASQAAGNLGTLVVRPALSTKMRGFNFMVRDGLKVNLIRNAYQVNPVKGVAKGNTLLSNDLELIVSRGLAPNLDCSLVLVSGQSVKAADQGATGNSWGYSSVMEAEVGYTIKALQDLRVALNLGTFGSSEFTGDPNYSFAKQFKWFNKGNTYMNLIVERAF